MRVAVIGAGIIGVTTAYELCADGHEVTVFERRGSVAAETSFANAGVIAPGYVTPWAAPGMPAKVLRYLASKHAPVRLRPTLAPHTAAWLWKWWRACHARTYQANRRRMQRLAAYSRGRLHEVTTTLKLDYDRIIDTATAGTETIDIRSELHETLWVNLAVRMGPAFGQAVPESVAIRAMQLEQQMFDAEP